MSIEPSGNSYKSTVVFAAEQFGIYSGNNPGNWQAAFFVYNGQVFIRSALIQEASIDFAKITDSLQSANFIPVVVDADGIYQNLVARIPWETLCRQR
ncbi:tail protein [Salmonella enterica subsp. enterica]|uniref:Tail protein n=1 Tax=Salmonella enterica I TaxID=59201 RepID=A0A379VMK7_SALET|nr:tail protein [Salmonella enterica subsp. enterica]